MKIVAAFFYTILSFTIVIVRPTKLEWYDYDVVTYVHSNQQLGVDWCADACDAIFAAVGTITSTWACVGVDAAVGVALEVFTENPFVTGWFVWSFNKACWGAIGQVGKFTADICKKKMCDDQICSINAEIAKCKDIEWNENVWGKSAKGVNLQSYIPMMAFIGCVGDGCGVDDFYCIEDANSIEFGVLTTTRVMRAAIGPAMPTSYIGCCSATYPNHVCNAPDDQVSANEICNKLGYSYAQFGKGTDNVCPEPHFDGVRWTSDWVMSAGSAQYYHCYN